MSSRLTPSERARFEAFLARSFERETRGTPPEEVTAVQQQFWAFMHAALDGHPMSSGLDVLDQLAADVIAGQPTPILRRPVCIMPPLAATGGDPSSLALATPTTTTPATARTSTVTSASTATRAVLSSTSAKTSTKVAKAPKASSKAAGSKRRNPLGVGASGKPAPKKQRSSGKVKAAPAKAGKVTNKPKAPSPTPCADVFGVSREAPDVVRQAIEEVLLKAQAVDKMPSRLAYPWAGRPLWYDPKAFPDVHRAHYRFWMTHRRAFWDWAFHAPLERGSSRIASRRKQKFRAVQARLTFLSFCIETWGFYAFLEKLETQPEMFWWGGQPGRTSSDARGQGDVYAEDLASLERRDNRRYQETIKNALTPVAIDAYGYPDMKTFLESTDALLPAASAESRLSVDALARIRSDLKSSVSPKATWVGSLDEDPWKSLINDRDIELNQVRIARELSLGVYEAPTAAPITKKELDHSEWSDYEEPEADEDEEEEEEEGPRFNYRGEEVSSEDEGEGGPGVGTDI